MLEREWVRDFVEINWYFRINTEQTEYFEKKKSTKDIVEILKRDFFVKKR